MIMSWGRRHSVVEKMKEADPWARSTETTRASGGSGLGRVEKSRPASGLFILKALLDASNVYII